GEFGVGLDAHEGAGVGNDAVIPFVVEPGHAEGGGGAGALADDAAGVGIVGEFDVAIFLGEGEDFVLDVFGIFAGDGVVFERALAVGRRIAAVGDEDAGHHWEALLG